MDSDEQVPRDLRALAARVVVGLEDLTGEGPLPTRQARIAEHALRAARRLVDLLNEPDASGR